MHCMALLIMTYLKNGVVPTFLITLIIRWCFTIFLKFDIQKLTFTLNQLKSNLTSKNQSVKILYNSWNLIPALE